MLRYDDHHHLTPGFLQFGKEGVQFIEQFLRADFIIRRFADAVFAATQRQQVKESRGATCHHVLPAKPAVQDRQIVIYREPSNDSRAVGRPDWFIVRSAYRRFRELLSGSRQSL